VHVGKKRARGKWGENGYQREGVTDVEESKTTQFKGATDQVQEIREKRYRAARKIYGGTNDNWGYSPGWRDKARGLGETESDPEA